MTTALAISWNDAKARRLAPVLVSLLIVSAVLPISVAVGSAAGRLLSVIVREIPAAGDTPEQLVHDLGGEVGRQIGIINGFEARVPAAGLSRLLAAPSIHSVTPNGRVRLQHAVDGFDADQDLGSMFYAQSVIGAGDYWNEGITGAGVDVALIDSGVLPVDGLTGRGKVVNGPDLSPESQADNLRYLDTYGHGTHIAGIIAGRDDASHTIDTADHHTFKGIAPDARIISVKVADSHGYTDVSQVIAAIDWVVQHRTDDGMNIRVLNLSFGTDGTQSYLVDPLAYAAEVAWRKGIVVVVAAGNGGYGTSALNNPATDPFVIAVGASESHGTNSVADDTIPSFSSTGSVSRHPDLVAPGRSIVGLRAPGSFVDLENPDGRVASRFFRGSGTSQAAAMVSGAAALIIQQRPGITPDKLKKLLLSSAHRLPHADAVAQGRGLIDLKAARDRPTPSAAKSVQNFAPATGSGSLELARGSHHLVMDDVELRGEVDIFGATFASATWAAECLAGSSWSGGTWNGNSWSGNSWSGNSWSGNSWSGNSWSGNSWSGNSWSGNSWSGNTWG